MNPVLWTLLLSAAATSMVLLERRRRGQKNILDLWAEARGLPCHKGPPLNLISSMEPLAVLPPLVEIERLVTGVIQDPPLRCGMRLLTCLAGNRHRPQRYLLGIFDSHPDLPPMRVLPQQELPDLPRDLGFVPLPASGLPPTYRAEGFTPLSRALTEAMGIQLGGAGPDFRLELRPGKLILATPILTSGQLTALLELQMALQHAMSAVLSSPPPPPDAGPSPPGQPPPGGRWIN